MALADESLAGHQAVVKLFATRIPTDAPSRVIEILLHGLKNGSDKLITQIHEPLQSSIHRLLSRFSTLHRRILIIAVQVLAI